MRRRNVFRAIAWLTACGCLCGGALLLAGPGDNLKSPPRSDLQAVPSGPDTQVADQTGARSVIERGADSSDLRDATGAPPALTPEEEEKLALEGAGKEETEAATDGAGLSPEELEHLLLEHQGKLPGPDLLLLPQSMVTLGLGGLGGPRATNNEAEPNDSKAAANAFTMVAGDTIVGTSTSSSGVGIDCFKVKTGLLALGVYKHRLTITSSIVGHTGTIRGLNQSSGVIGTTDTAVQTTSTSTTPPRYNQWYGFGKEEEIYYRVTGTTSTTADYTSTLTTEPVTIIAVPGVFQPGSITITTYGQGHTSDTDLWLYDGSLNAIAGAGNDDAFGQSYSQSTLTRTLASGEYYVAVTNYNFANNQASPADDDFRGGPVLDFANAAANSNTTASVNVAFSITDLTGIPVAVAATKVAAYDVVWAKFTVIVPEVGACCFGYSCTPDMTPDACATAGGQFMGLGTPCTPNPCVGACCVNYACVANNSAAECATLGGTWYLGQDCGTFFCPPWNDNCSAVTPVPLTAGVPVQFLGDNRGSTNDCAGFTGGQTWEAFSLPATYGLWDVTLDYCGTAGPFGNAWLNLTTACPCGTNTAAGTFDTTTCGDGNVTIRWTGLAPGNYWYPVMLDPAVGAAGPYTINVVAVPGYCASRATNTADSTVDIVSFGSIYNDTTGVCDTYDNFTGLSTTVAPGSLYPMSITIGDCTPTSCYAKWCKVYIDWNRDYDFADAGEEVLSGGATSGTPCTLAITGDVTVPIDAVTGLTRMRVVVNEAGQAAVAPCGTYTYGATEDYTINVIEPVGACCIGEDCTETTPSACAGIWQGPGTDCDPNPCALPLGACCFADGTCTQAKEPICTALGGVSWTEGVPCEPTNPCPQPEVACCYQDGSCLMQTAADCTLAGGTPGAYPSSCTPNPCPQPGNDCTNPIVVALPAMGFPYVDDNTTCGRLNDYATTCLGSYDGGEDIIYRIDVTQDMCLIVDMDTTATWTGMAIHNTCPLDPTTCLYKATIAGAGGVTLNNVLLSAAVGSYYVMIDTYPSPTCIPQFTLTITQCPTGACCVGEVCTIESPAACTTLGGVYIGNDVPCDPSPCLTRACCLPTGECQNLTQEACTAASGTWYSTQTCGTFTCPPPNDNCAQALAVTDGVPAATGNNCAATDDGVASCQANSHKDVWFVYTATCTGTVTMSTENSVLSDTVLSVLTACGGTEIACNDDGGTTPPLSALLTFNAIAGTQYIVRVAAYSTSCGVYNLNIICDAWPQGACCLGTTCYLDYEPTCEGAGGLYLGDDTACSGLDCNSNGIDDACDIGSGVSEDCNDNGIPDECDIAAGAPDVDMNGVPDECQPDCNNNGVLDACELPGGCATGNCGTIYPDLCGSACDCQGDGIPDACQLGAPGRGCTAMVYDAGTCDGVNGTRPTVGWNDTGILDKFQVPQAGGPTSFSCFHMEILDFAQTDMPTMRLRVYSLPTGSIPADLPSFTAATPVFDHTYTVAGGELTITSRAPCYATALAWDYDAEGPAFDLTPGSYALLVNFPGSGAVNYWASAVDEGMGLSYVWGAQVDAPSVGTMAVAWNLKGGGGGAGADCNNNGIPDECDMAPLCQAGQPCFPAACSADCEPNLIPDECEVPPIGTGPDCNGNGIPDDCELAGNDCNSNGVPDDCDIALGTSSDCQGDGIPDECQLGTGGGGGIVVNEGFVDITNLPGWFTQNNSEPLGVTNWSQGSTTVFNAQAGAATSYISANYNNTGSIGNISNWLLTPEVTLVDGMVLDFYTRGPTCTTCYADRLQVRASLNGASTNVGTGWTAVGDFTMLLLDINPTLVANGYPQTWDAGHFTVTISGVPTPMQGRLAFRYFVEDGGENGTNSNYIGIDTVTLSGVPTPPSNDCNENGIPDECDIHVSFGGYCQGAIPSVCDSDYNTNGVPDHCEVCGDLNGDGAVNVDDYWIFVDAFGWCFGAPKYNLAADMDGNGCVNLVDYQAWLVCYRMYTGRDFALPKTKTPNKAVPSEVSPHRTGPSSLNAG